MIILAIAYLTTVTLAIKVTVPLGRTDVTIRRPNVLATSGLPLGGAHNAYYATIAIGTPPVDFTTLLDTGSSDLIVETAVQNDSCTGCVTDGPLYDPNASSTANVSTIPFSIQYGIGFDTGVLAEEVVSFGGVQVFGACSRNSDFSLLPVSTALLGLAWEQIASTNSTPFIESLWRSGQLDEPLFALALGSGASTDDLTSAAGFLTIGGTNTSNYTGDLQWLDLPTSEATAGFWGLPITDVTVEGLSLMLSTDNAILDSGTNLIILPSAVADAIYALIPNSLNDTESSHWYYPCDAEVNIAFTMNGTAFSINPSDFSRGSSGDGTYCLGAINKGGDDPSWTIGTTLMHSYYSVFRFDPPSIGLAPLVQVAATLAKGGGHGDGHPGSAPPGGKVSPWNTPAAAQTQVSFTPRFAKVGSAVYWAAFFAMFSYLV